MKNKLKRFLVKRLPVGLKNEILKPYIKSNSYYSQEGEDVILERLFEGLQQGFYVDIGAHHPIRFSNTFKFYLKGWRGINIDAMPGSMEEFIKIRPNDINLELPISEEEREAIYYIFNEPALNTFSEEMAESKNGYKNFRIVETRKLKMFPLSTILDKHVPKGTKINFMSVDVEGFDLQVLKSNNWERFQPEVLLVEEVGRTLEEIFKGEVYNYLNDLGYKLISKTYNTLIFRKSE
ncbi:FkbM family methyltransferase [Pontibacter diazotrophicus]|uniref:FkbM family methyltransferase n=1 Tax=Pontibacter diazotrophicus TaxID=1400979 RepID=A0A3D8LBV2_9BACT|nr:FkbM family methyltransferase [Pontibacter diazotrophicus]RDV14875.1 FkbM family methyltransferase [Pontibacter diazotrophicus]